MPLPILPIVMGAVGSMAASKLANRGLGQPQEGAVQPPAWVKPLSTVGANRSPAAMAARAAWAKHFEQDDEEEEGSVKSRKRQIRDVGDYSGNEGMA